MKILTFGSCLSRFTGLSYGRMFGGQVAGSVYHNRIDRFVRTYVRGEVDELPLEALGDFERTATPKAALVLNNQFRSRTLGRHGTVAGEGFMREIEEKVDLVLLDNYVDIVARLCTVPRTRSAGVFVNPRELSGNAPRLVLEESHLAPEAAMPYWHELIAWIRDRQKGTKIFFLNFPMAHHTRADYIARAAAFEAIFQTRRVRVVPPIEVPPFAIATKSHFTPEYYAMLAGYVWKARRNTAAPLTPEEAADDVLNG